jgi:hypothetical protein
MIEKNKNRSLFLLVLTKEILKKEENYLKKVYRASNKNKPMYIIIKDEIEDHSFIQFPWRLIFHFHDERGFDRAIRRIYEDFMMYKTIQDMR